MEFDNDRALMLIELYRRHRVLWDPKHPLYYSKAKKSQAWTEVASRVGGPILDIRRKMESLLGSFRRERARARRGCLGPRGRHEPYNSSWFAYDHMKFLIGRDNPKKPRRLGAKLQFTEDEEPPDQVDSVVAEEGIPEAQESYTPLLHSTFGEETFEEAHGVIPEAETEPVETTESELQTEVKPSAMVLPRTSTRRLTRLAAREDLRTIAGKSWRNLRISAKGKSHASEGRRGRITSWRRRRGATKIPDISSPPPPVSSTAHEQATCITSSSGPKLEPQPSPRLEFVSDFPHRCHRTARPATDQDVSGAFGAYVSSKLRSYCSRTRAIVEHLISNLLFEADMGKYDPQETLVQVENPAISRCEVGQCDEEVAASTRERSPTGDRESPPLIVTYRQPSSAEENAEEQGKGNKTSELLQTLPLPADATVKEEPLLLFDSGDEFPIDE